MWRYKRNICRGKRGKDMGLRFRKSIKIAPGLKINLNKNSVSATIGTKGAHYTVNSKGKKTVSAGIPGTGISYVKTVGGSKQAPPAYNTPKHYSGSSSNNMPPNNHDDTVWYKRTGWIVFWLVFFFPVGLFLMWKYSNWKKIIKSAITAYFLFFGGILAFSPDLKSISLKLDDSKTYYVNQSIPIQTSVSPDSYTIPESAYKSSGGEIDLSDDGIVFTASKAGTYKIWADHQGVKSKKLVVDVKKKKLADKKDLKKKRPTFIPTAVPVNADLLTTPLFTANENHSDRVEQINITAKENASSLTDEQANQIVNEIKSLNHQYFTDNALMEQLMWHGYLLYYHCNDGDVRKDIGENLTQCIPNVYCNSDTIDSDHATVNFAQIDENIQRFEQQQAQLEAQRQAEQQAQLEAQRQAELQAQQEAEAARIAAEQEAALQAQQQSQAQMVWISATGSKYHSYNSCGQMNPATSYQMSLSDAQAQGYEPCKRCH